jgi:hypothetical protein
MVDGGVQLQRSKVLLDTLDGGSLDEHTRGLLGALKAECDEVEGLSPVLDLMHRINRCNGAWLISGCEVLNQGWGAMPEDQQPGWWKERYPEGYAA